MTFTGAGTQLPGGIQAHQVITFSAVEAETIDPATIGTAMPTAW